jgi:hypothetical protein
MPEVPRRRTDRVEEAVRGAMEVAAQGATEVAVAAEGVVASDTCSPPLRSAPSARRLHFRVVTLAILARRRSEVQPGRRENPINYPPVFF